MNDEIEEMCKAAVDAINVSYEDYDQDSDLYEGFMEGFNAAWKQLTAERDRLRKALEDIVGAIDQFLDGTTSKAARQVLLNAKAALKERRDEL